ncbi:hypothetical protein [Enterococcus sp. 5B3_DIV0040]|uniref:hypothetical protein n=1 Tax=Enterococcus sp. 5B3_DIV0040 TaxID=1834182 RepID=UPI000A337E59|nr:hypothetical protein [Enterococcus sp. 5B3_DIV0040]OTO05133.1 hypothetical protein A5883_002123 [Enterococcus sp. 5B3_DIV0040]
MKLFQWLIETVAVQQNGVNKMHVFQVTTFEQSKEKAMDIARMKMKRKLKREKVAYLRITICWIQLTEVVQRTKYEEYKQLARSRKSQKVIAQLLELPFWELNEYERRFRKERRLQRKRQANSN